MWCDQQFAKFDGRLKLDKGRQERITSALGGFVEFCRRDDQLRAAMSDAPFLQGSVPSGTAIRPLGNDEYDVDVIYPFRLAALSDRAPAAIFRWFAGRVQESPIYRGKLTLKHRCVRVNYAGDFHMDIIPSTRDVPGQQPYAVPTRDLAAWVTNDPTGLVDWIRTKDRASGMPDADGDGAFIRSVRMMKRWRDQFFGTDPRPSSILLTTILGRHEASVRAYNPPLTDPLYPGNRHDAAYLYDMLRLTHGCIQHPESRPFAHPIMPAEDLRRDWDATFTTLFLDRLAACIAHLRRGIDATNDPQAAGHFQQAFGETFPRE